MTRRLSREERGLWERLSRTVRPLRKRTAERSAEPEPKSNEATAAKAKKPRAAPSTKSTKTATPARKTPPLQPLEERVRRRLARGTAEVDARIDLHGMRQERAFRALGVFLRRSQAQGARVALVITGKGRAGDDERGVLYQSVPLWLARPEFRDLVVGFEEAGRRHGGAGALYVRVRQRRAARSQRESLST